MPTKSSKNIKSIKKSKKVGKKSKKLKKSTKKVEIVSDVEVEAPRPVKKRHSPTKESVLAEFDEIVASIEEEVSRLRESVVKTTGVKYLRSLCKRVKTTRAHADRVMKTKKKTTRRNNANSGFLKPVEVSREICEFTGWKTGELKSRVDVTKFLCNYIKEHDLQNPSDRRQILADKKLATLLNYDKKSEKPLTYYALQTYLKPHFVKTS